MDGDWSKRTTFYRREGWIEQARRERVADSFIYLWSWVTSFLVGGEGYGGGEGVFRAVRRLAVRACFRLGAVFRTAPSSGCTLPFWSVELGLACAPVVECGAPLTVMSGRTYICFVTIE